MGRFERRDSRHTKSVMAGPLSRPSMNTASGEEPLVQVVPIGIVPFDRIDLPVTLVFFERFLPLNCGDHALVMFIPDEPLQAVFLGEPVDDAFAVLPHASNQVAGCTDLERAMLSVDHHVNGNKGITGNHGRAM